MCALSYITYTRSAIQKKTKFHTHTHQQVKLYTVNSRNLLAARVASRLRTERFGVRIPTAGTDVHFPINVHNSSGGHQVSFFLTRAGVPPWG